MDLKSEEKLLLSTYLSYGTVAMPLALVAITFYVYIPKFYSDHVGVSLVVIGNVVLFSRVWDALIDPAMGRLSDATRSTWGRRRPWILAAVLPLCFSFYLLLVPGLNPGWLSPSAWFACFTIVFFLFWTMHAVPYESLGPELSFDYKERNRLFGVREGAFVLGTLFAAVIPYLYDSWFGEEMPATKYFWLAIVYGSFLLLSTLACAGFVRERPLRPKKDSSVSFFSSFKQTLSNRPFRILLVAYTIGAFGGTLPATLILYYVEYVLGEETAFANLALIVYFLLGFCCLPFWVWLAGKIGKKEAWMAAMFVNTTAFAGVFFLGAGDATLYMTLVSCSAIGYGATLALPSSMQADVIDYDELQSGERNEGTFVGFWAVAKKLSAALGAGIGLQVLGATGYEPNVEQSNETVFALRFLYAAVPSICSFIAMCIAWKYPIDEEKHREIRAEIEARNMSEDLQ